MSFLNPESVLNQIPIKDNAKAADFGCGSGGWVIPLSRKIKNGQIYAIDIIDEALSALKLKMEAEKVYNIRIIRSDLDKEKGSTLRNENLDLVIVSNLLFQTEKKKEVIKESFRVLNKKGLLLVVDWLPNSASGPAERTSPQEVKQISEEIGFNFIKEVDAGIFHFGHIYEKN